MTDGKTEFEQSLNGKPVTFIAYARWTKRKAVAGIKDEQKRIKKARQAFDRYSEAMRLLRYHPLTRLEIEDRGRELESMLRESTERYGDNENMRIAFKMHYGKES